MRAQQRTFSPRRLLVPWKALRPILDSLMVAHRVPGIGFALFDGLGVGNNGNPRYIYHTGNNVFLLADFIYGVEENLGCALLTHSANGSALAAAVERRLFGRNRR